MVWTVWTPWELLSYFCFFFLPHYEAYGISVPQRSNLGPAVKVPNHWTAREFPIFNNKIHLPN